MKITSEINLFDDEYQEIIMTTDLLIEKLEKNKLKKYDREILISAVNLIYELAKNQI